MDNKTYTHWTLNYDNSDINKLIKNFKLLAPAQEIRLSQVYIPAPYPFEVLE